MVTEIELKLEVTTEAAAFLEASPLLEGTMAKTKLHAQYFDTPGHDLANNGLALRIRRSGKKSIQTVKGEGGPAAGLFDRSEWELPVSDSIPVMDERTPVPALLAGSSAALAPIFDVKVERRTWIVTEGDSSIELVIDRGAVQSGTRTAPICEVELELKAGSADALFVMARKLDAVAPVRLGVLSKSERGHLLLRHAPTSFKAEPVLLHPGLSAGEAFQHIALLCLRQFRLNEMLLGESRNGEALHQARVAIRRLRSALSIFKALLPDARLAHFRGEFKYLAGLLGDARDIDVMLAKAPPGGLRDRLEAARVEAYTHVETALASDRIRWLILDFVQWAGSSATAQEAGEPAAAFAAAALRRIRKKVKGHGAGFKRLSDEDRHDFRKLAKKMRYAAEFFGSLFLGKHRQRDQRRFVRKLEKLQDSLGLLNDLVAGEAMLDRLGFASDPDAAALTGHRNKAKLLVAAAAGYENLLAAPKFWA
ncbi:MAG TPA: CHAD domain-containing protein [Sphingobium sp.]